MEKEYYIILNPEEIISALEDEVFSETEKNGYFGVHIQPGVLEAYEVGTEEKPFRKKVTFHQNGNYYPPDTGYVSEFAVMDFFDEDALYDSGAMGETLSEIRAEARRDWADCNNIDLEIVEENFWNEEWEYYESVEKQMDQWESTAIDFFTEQAMANRLEEVRDERREDVVYVYKIIWDGE